MVYCHRLGLRLRKASLVSLVSLVARWQLILKTCIVVHLVLEFVSGFFISLDLGLVMGTFLLDLTHQGLDLLLLLIGSNVLLVNTLALAANRIECLAHVAWKVSFRWVHGVLEPLDRTLI